MLMSHSRYFQVVFNISVHSITNQPLYTHKDTGEKRLLRKKNTEENQKEETMAIFKQWLVLKKLAEVMQEYLFIL